jgi:hypothetical protein
MEEPTKKCPFCGETISEIAIKCKHCGRMLNENPNSTENGNEEEQILADKPANMFRGMEAVGGRIKITNKKVVFKSHALNIQKITEEIPLNNIESVTKRNTLGIIPNGMSVKLKSGIEYKFVVSGREKLISLIEKYK